MEVFRLTRDKYAFTLKASGVANRWNYDKEYVMYAGSSRSLATLEMVVRRNSVRLANTYHMMVIAIPHHARLTSSITPKMLPKNWRSIDAYGSLQALGSAWYKSQKSLLLKVPSVIIEKEYNYIINTQHPDFKKHVLLRKPEAYFWDERLL